MTITSRDGFSVTLKILGFYFIYRAFYSLSTIVSYLMILANPSQRAELEFSGVTKFAMFAPIVVPLVLAVVTAYILLKFSDKISEKLIKTDKEIQIFGADNWQKEVFILSLRIFGVYEIAGRFATLVWQIALLKDYKDDLYTLVRMAIGVYFLLGAKHLVNLVFKEKKIEPIAGQPPAVTN